MAEEATLDPRPGGVVRWAHANGDTCRGEFVELVPDRRVVFSYGWAIYFGLVSFGIAVLMQVKHWRCAACGHRWRKVT